ncbi:cyclopropane-fatty-acyl-phospholipid synthase [Candidatus Saccharibacteria bacterium CG11_big_fil_rev_8_21_14_0_20_41_19]|nr:cyclopropane fatty acyl phospholipid synthase [Candidatus Saccharibacteria bacterium]OIP85810.1 MAG: cyclopropane-fatty-acyl-phospholipid synthase [Candidatus Saccharibacteria bacterium CG2_30_41_52]PIQ70925.1 MAG: cyclopropane-fatty-acyl-phospholipid synthase [Candidatus Saccharibacteria bacterium CG11_big_fil_rev_8_21_14_0_20_41_19]PIZ61161.1 MAG: cyclopropane-fatty-acyl-phospholipid synthase [Candidatus Saccharibacteria bacterium CG_4_10_14_0_2_um_filter_41_11]PJC29979.1 MAG: cyclopropane
MRTDRQIAQSLLESAGITIDGPNDYDMQVHNEELYSRVLRQGAIGLGESYMDGWWDVPKLDQFFEKIIGVDLDEKIKGDWGILLKASLGIILNAGRKSKAFQVGQAHYDIGNDLYHAMLDKRLVYTCGYWKDASNLDQSQDAKLDLVCKKIGLKKGQTVLDIGSGWGSFIKFAAEKYGAKTTGVTVSIEQKKLADELNKNLPATTILEDYRDINQKFDHVVSLGMFEHVGYKNYRTYMKVAHKALNDNGLFLLHTIGGNNSTHSTDPWLGKYIFPNSMIPSIQQISKSIEGLFVMEDWHNFGPDYDKTLMQWYKNFEKNWNKLSVNYDERFHRMWRYYLLQSAAGFRARKLQLWQIVLSKNNVSDVYKSIR